MKNEKILFVYTGGNEVHRRFASTITKDFIKSSWKLPKGYSIYFTEGDFFKAVFLRQFGLINRKSKIINLFSDPRLYQLKEGFCFDFKTNRVKKYPFIKKILMKWAIKKLDAAICVGNYQENLLKEIRPDIKMAVVPPFVSNKRLKEMIPLNPALGKKNCFIITRGADFYYKGLDLLLEVFKEIHQEDKEVQLFILGDDSIFNNFKGYDLEGIHFLGFITNLNPILKKCCLYVHPGRGEAFGVVVLEAMAGGCPAIVSNQTGAKEAVKKVRGDFVVPLNKDKIKEKVKFYLNLSIEEKRKLSKKSKLIAKTFDEKTSLEKFYKKFNQLI